VPVYSLGIDIGGTFTDIVAYDHDTGRQWSRKVLTTHDDPVRAVVAGAAAVIIGHNHPSGDATPSRDDIVITEQLRSAGRLLGIEVLDHVIIGDGTTKYVSLRERGWN